MPTPRCVLFVSSRPKATPELVKTLSRSGFEILRTGAAGEAALSAKRPVLIVIDGSVPDEAAARMTAAAKAPVVRLSPGRKRTPAPPAGADGLLWRVFDALPGMLVVRDAAGAVQMTNRVFRDLIEADPDNVTLPPPTPSHIEWRDIQMRARDGRAIETRWTTAALNDGWTVSVGQDVTQRKLTEDLLRTSDARLRAFLSSEMVLALGPDLLILDCSPALEGNLGYRPGELSGRNLLSLAHPDDTAELRRATAEASKGHTAPTRMEFRARDRAGEWRCVGAALSKFAPVDSAGAVLVACTDLTERKRMESDLRQSHDRLRQLAAHTERVREQERTLLAREVHDELGQMLTVLKMDVESLASHASRDRLNPVFILNRSRQMIEHIETSIGWVKRIAADLRPGVLDHLGIAAAIEWQAQEFERRTGVRCLISMATIDLELTPAQTTAVFRIFQEILTNITRHACASTVRVRMTVRDRELTLQVRDNGKGIEPSHLEDKQALGLLGMRERALMLHGAIDFRGRPGRGTTVTLRMPLAPSNCDRADSGAAQAAVDHDELNRPGLRILLADDHAIVRQGMRELLSRSFKQAHIDEAEDGQQVLDMVGRKAWDILILDISMPKKSGLQVLKEIRSAGIEAPVLVLSMHSEHEYGKRVLEAGGSGFVTKSMACNQLVQAVGKALAGERYFSPMTLGSANAAGSAARPH